jgi:hypothetical protein
VFKIDVTVGIEASVVIKVVFHFNTLTCHVFIGCFLHSFDVCMVLFFCCNSMFVYSVAWIYKTVTIRVIRFCFPLLNEYIRRF